MGAFVDFSKAVFASLNGSPELIAIVGAGRVRQDVPVDGEPGWAALSATAPYVVVGDQQGAEAGTSDTDASEMQITIDAWSRGAGNQQALAMIDAIHGALHNKSMFVSHGVLVYLYYLAHETLPGGDRETWHGIIRFRGLYQYG